MRRAALIKQLTGGRGADVVLDMTSGGAPFAQSVASLAPFGRLVVYGVTDNQATSVAPRQLVGLNQSISGYYVASWSAERNGPARAALATLVELIEGGRVKVEVGHSFPLSQAADAHRLLEGRRARGKIVLRPWLEA